MSVIAAPRVNEPLVHTVEHCYDLLDLATLAGIYDFTDGKYDGWRELPYEMAQKQQAEYLFEEARLRPGDRLLDIGCGYGRLLSRAKQRGMDAIGISLSDRQVRYCRFQNLKSFKANYRSLPHSWNEKFDGIIANGSLEHFVSPEAAAAGFSNDIYREMFQICHRLLKPAAKSLDDGTGDKEGRFVTTAIHFGSVQIDPHQIVSHQHFPRGSALHHYWLLTKCFGGFYPQLGQLQYCAEGLFELEREEDGTEDYLWTSEHWLAELKRAFYTNPRFVLAVIRKWLHRPRDAQLMLDCLLGSQSWNWQFRGANPPMRLRRQTWRTIEDIPSVGSLEQAAEKSPFPRGNG